MKTKAQRKIFNYIFQLREIFTIPQIVEDTGVCTTTVYMYMQELLKQGKIEKVIGSKNPQKYVYVYKDEKRTKKSNVKYRYKDEFFRTFRTLKRFKIKDVMEMMNVSYSQARRHILNFSKKGFITPISQDGHEWIYEYGSIDSKDRKEKVIDAIENLIAKNIEITKKNILDETDISLATIKLAMQELKNDGVLNLERINNHEKVYRYRG